VASLAGPLPQPEAATLSIVRAIKRILLADYSDKPLALHRFQALR